MKLEIKEKSATRNHANEFSNRNIWPGTMAVRILRVSRAIVEIMVMK